jgi:hypothetical protein
LSVTVGANVTTAEQALVVMLAGQVIVGLVVSLTVTLNEQRLLLLLPLVTTAVQVTGVVPLGNVEPLAGVQVVVGVPQGLLEVTVHFTTCEQEVDVVLVVMLPGPVMVGGGGSSVTVKVHELTLPQSSTAVQVTLVLPEMKLTTPGNGEQMMFGTPPQVSVAVGGTYCTTPPEHTVLVPRLHTQGQVRLPQ